MLKRLQRYVLIEVLKGFLPAFLALAFIMVLGFCVQLLHEGLDVVRLPELVPAIFMYAVPLVLPAAFLTAVLIGFGRLAADNELLAVRVGGVKLTRVVLPVCALAILLSAMATAFQFEVVPFARRRIELLKYKAIKQILIDKVALTSKRQFAFGPYHIQYDGYENGKMKGLLFLQTYGGRPHRMVRAAEGEVVSHPKEESCAQFKFNDCILTGFGEDELIGQGTTTCDSFVYTQQVVPELEEVGTDVKHLRTEELLAHLRSLEEKVSQHPRILEDPDQVADDMDDEIQKLRSDKLELQNIIDEKQKEIDSFYERDKPKREQRLDVLDQQIEKMQQEVKTLNEEEIAVNKKMRDIQEQNGGNSYERLRSLESKRKEIRDRIKSLEEGIVQKEREKRELSRDLVQDREEAERHKEEIAGLEKDVEKVTAHIQELHEKKTRAEVQEELRSAWIRIHKRLALALSVLVFTMVGLPLGMMTRHHSAMLAFGIGFAIVLFAFYPALIVGQRMAQVGVMPSGLPLWLDTGAPMWAGNIFIFLVGSILTWRSVGR